MSVSRNLLGDPVRSAGARMFEYGASSLMRMRVARSLHERWRRMSSNDRVRLQPLAQEVKDQALDLRGRKDPDLAGQELGIANERLADAMLVSAETNPDVTDIEVRRLRADLALELERVASGEIRASRGPGHAAAGDATADGHA